ncbi:MAG TPA: thiamine phosphate synthase [Oscillatoriaceae cyanobacterium M33_DOE_052]|uniref:Thiamine-phosphate synthase n=1 Tax=Planktothricoides sp. SpSt-374 TaxID=2282167 RepID=A0A7C3VQ09_9CYAN|nr:thiamine phosphate synthase [Oscillatoriaceae cyanobacterium M33_DOE_052]
MVPMGDVNQREAGLLGTPRYMEVQLPAVCRILDANLDRAREGLRIIEEWCRFGLNSAEMAMKCKQLRQEVGLWHRAEIRAARDTAGDLGTELTHPGEEVRSDIAAVLQANFCRVQEAMRVVEEYGKLYHPDMGSAFKQLRYQVYTLETGLMSYRRIQRLAQAYLYLVTNPRDNLLATVEAALKGGVDIVQYRDKNADDKERLRLAQSLRQLCSDYGALFLINDRVDMAMAVGADGVHLGQDDMPIALARQLLGPGKLIGISTTQPEEMGRAMADGADYIGVGPVYETPTKAGKAAAGLDYVRYAAANATVPWFAIGGINTNNIAEVVAGGARRVAVVRSLVEAEQPTLVAQYLRSQLTAIRRGNS